jgi:hypothetical protein
MIGLNKVLCCNDLKTRYIFIFKFIDNILFCEYNKIDFSNFEIKQGGRTDRNKNEIYLYCYIPVNYLKSIEELY